MVADENANWLVEAELLKGWIRGSSAPPLVSTSASTVPRNEAGVLSNLTTSSIFGDGLLDTGHRTGTRFRLQRSLATEGDYGSYFGGLSCRRTSVPINRLSLQRFQNCGCRKSVGDTTVIGQFRVHIPVGATNMASG